MSIQDGDIVLDFPTPTEFLEGEYVDFLDKNQVLVERAVEDYEERLTQLHASLLLIETRRKQLVLLGELIPSPQANHSDLTNDEIDMLLVDTGGG